jgi:raffinose/stachyose/melibiose transport system substrate-binding protein
VRPNPEDGMAFIEFLGSEQGQEIYAGEGAALPGLPRDDFDADPALDVLIDFQAEGRTVPSMDQMWPNPEVQQEHFNFVQQLFAGDTTIEEGLDAMDELYQQGE